MAWKNFSKVLAGITAEPIFGRDVDSVVRGGGLVRGQLAPAPAKFSAIRVPGRAGADDGSDSGRGGIVPIVAAADLVV